MTKPDFEQPIMLDAQELRSLAETAASLRGPKGDRYFFVQEGSPGRGKLKEQHGQPGQSPPEGTVIQLDTAAQQPDRPKVTAASITAEGETFPLGKYDAVFWTEGAVEKFVFPYLASKSMWSAAFLLTELSRAWYGFIPGKDPQGRGESPIPFAIAHIPDSDFVTIPTEPGHDLHVLSRVRVREGESYRYQVRATSLADLIAGQKPEIP